MTQFLLTALGSYGDVHPMAGLGAALAVRGHQVKVITNPYFEDVISGAGIEFLPLGTSEEYIELAQHPDLWHPTRGPKLVLGFSSDRFLRPLYDLIASNYVAGETVLCAHPLDFASRVAAETLAAPVANVVFAPGILWSVYDSPRLKGALLGPRVPRWLKRLQFWAANRFFVAPLFGGTLTKLRRELGLPSKKISYQWMFETDLMLGLFPDWFGEPQPDWPTAARTVGFPLWDSHNDDPLPADISEFLAVGEPPIAFSPGSANHEAHQFFVAAVDSCRRMNRRGILLTKYNHQLPKNLPANVRHVGFVPMSKLLPRTAALVHHGGIGSCAQAFAAGIPQIVRPMSYDQFDNSRRVERLGVGREVSVRRFSGDAVATALEPMLHSDAVKSKCRELASRCDGVKSLTAGCEALEQLAASRLC
jgi:rhamnosyltransferase subunit B